MYLKTIAFAVAAAPILPTTAAAQVAGSDAAQQAELTEQDRAIARLIEVWGFVKYHHHGAREGRIAMDVEFVALYPAIRKARSLREADAVLTQWLERIGPGAPCDPCSEPVDPSDIAIETNTPRWLETLPVALSEPLGAIYANRSGAGANFQVEKRPGVGNPLFANEADYSNTGRLDEESLHMLALARQWNTLRYWFPYRDVMDRDPHAVLDEAVAQFLAAGTPEDRRRARLRLAAQSDDGHVGIREYEADGSPPGDCIVPYSWRIVEDRLVIDGRAMPDEALLQRGDIVVSIDGERVEDLAARYAPFIAASNEAWLGRVTAARLARGECGEHELGVERAGAERIVSVEWLQPAEAKISLYPGHDRDGDVIQQLPGDVTYVRFPLLTKDQLPQLLEAANGSRGLVLDMRGYLRDFHIFELGKLLVDEPTQFVVFTSADLSTPGRFRWGGSPTIMPDPEGARITVPVVAIVDEATISSPEYHAMAWRAAGVPIIGSSTAGADGNVSTMPLPDGAEMSFSGIGVYYPDRSPTQRVGIVPDIEVAPTIEGIAAGRDEQLDRAITEVLRLAEAG